MTTKQFLLTATLLGAALSLPVAGFAQSDKPERSDRAPRHEMRERMAQKMAEKLNLTDAQKQQMKALREQHKAAMDKLQAEGKEAREQFRDKAQALQKQFRDQRRALLTPEQLKIADEMEAKMKDRAEHRRGHRKGHGRGHHGDDREDAPAAPKSE